MSLKPDKGRIKINDYLRTSGENGTGRFLVIAVSVKAGEFPVKFDWAEQNSFALEYTPDPLTPELIAVHVSPYLEKGLPVRYHTRFFDYDIGNADEAEAEEALRIHKQVIDAMEGLGEPVVTVHLNLNRKISFNEKTAVKNLTSLADYGKRKGITVDVENLKRGASSIPADILKWARESGAMITMDVGHAVSSDYVKEGKTSAPDIVNLFSERLNEVHMYGEEEDRHYPIDDISGYTAIIDSLLVTNCNWWTIELDDYEEIIGTRRNLLDYLQMKSRKVNK